MVLRCFGGNEGLSRRRGLEEVEVVGRRENRKRYGFCGGKYEMVFRV